VPGNVTSRNSQGTNRLIKEGAKLIESAEDIIEELKPQIQGILRERNISQGKVLPEMTDDERLMLGILNDEPKHIDIIVRNTQLSSSKALSILLSLELKGVVRQIEGKRFAVA
jgi:DNA processing protein